MHTEFRAPHEIISDLLGFVGLNESGYDEHIEEINVVTAEARAYLDMIENNRLAWQRIEEMHKQNYKQLKENYRYDPCL